MVLPVELSLIRSTDAFSATHPFMQWVNEQAFCFRLKIPPIRFFFWTEKKEGKASLHHFFLFLIYVDTDRLMHLAL